MQQQQVIFGSIHDPPMGVITDDMEGLYQNYYRPLLKTLYSHPHIYNVLFFSGRLLQWLEKYHGEFFDVLAEMVKRRQTEILGGGFYTPMMNLISKQDCIGQIELLTTYLRRNFGRRSRGCWITEQIWEPSMPSILKSAGMDYTFLSDYHYWKAGFEERDFHTPCITEDQGKFIEVLPMSYDIYQNFWQIDPDAIQTKIEESKAYNEDQIIGLIHNAPQSGKDINNAEAHLDGILCRLEELAQSKKIRITLPSHYLRDKRKYCRGYFPVTSFDEMQAYDSISALESYLYHKGTITSGVGRTGYYYGSFFRQNLSRYTEVNLMYAKMHFVHSLTTQIRGDKYRRQSAREELWKGQSHTAFWHGNRGGVYINNYRKDIYSSLICSEKLTREQGIFAPALLSLDFDMDGLDEYLYQGNLINAYIHSIGGVLFELDYLPAPWNYLDTMGRYPEVYHGSDQEFRGYDSYPRRCFIDHFLNQNITLEQFSRMAFENEAMLATLPYSINGNGGLLKKKPELSLYVESDLSQIHNNARIRLEKTYSFVRRGLRVRYRLINIGEEPIHTIFSPEINLSFLSGNVNYLRLYSNSSKGKKVEIDLSALELKPVAGITFEDYFNKVKIDVDLSQAAECWILPLETEHIDRNIWQQTYQGSTVLPRWAIDMEAGEEFACEIAITLSPIKVH